MLRRCSSHRGRVVYGTPMHATIEQDPVVDHDVHLCGSLRWTGVSTVDSSYGTAGRPPVPCRPAGHSWNSRNDRVPLCRWTSSCRTEVSSGFRWCEPVNLPCTSMYHCIIVPFSTCAFAWARRWKMIGCTTSRVQSMPADRRIQHAVLQRGTLREGHDPSTHDCFQVPVYACRTSLSRRATLDFHVMLSAAHNTQHITTPAAYLYCTMIVRHESRAERTARPDRVS